MVICSPSFAQPQIGAATSRCRTMLSVKNACKRTFACVAGAKAKTAARIHRDVRMGVNSPEQRGCVNNEAAAGFWRFAARGATRPTLSICRRGGVIREIERFGDEDFAGHFAKRGA